MPKPSTKRDLVVEFIRSELERFYNEKNNRKIVRKNPPQFNSKAKLIRYVLNSESFIEADKFQAMTPIEKASIPKERIAISANTVRDAINQLLDEADIEIKDGCLVWRPKPSFDEKRFPILQIANQIEVTINVPEYTFFLTVPSEFSTAIIEYLSEHFHKDDIIFIPMGRFIMCVSVLPETVLFGVEKKIEANATPYMEQCVQRVVAVLHKFKWKFPSFTYRLPYEMNALTYQNSPIKHEVHGMIKNSSKKHSNIGKEFAAFQDGFTQLTEMAERNEQARSKLRNQIDESSPEKDDPRERLPNDDDSDAGIDPETGLPYIDPETGLPYLEETEALSEEDMEIAAYAWGLPDEIDEAIEQDRKAKARKENAPAATQEDESK